MPVVKITDELPDVQQDTTDFPKKSIKKVGIRNVIVPLNVIRQDGTINQSSADISIYTNLTDKVKGANMSRYRILIEEMLLGEKLKLTEYISELLHATSELLESTNSYIKINFDYFLLKESPIVKIKSHTNYECSLEGVQIEVNDKVVKKTYLTVKTPYTSLCPCSKQISKYGAHNQRSIATVKVELIPGEIIWIEDIIKIVEASASAPIINGLKRPDEAYQTELMYENPRFVEDMVRIISTKLDDVLDNKISDYTIISEHFESIHTHTACAIMTAGRNLK